MQVHPKNYWTKERCESIAKNFSTSSAFQDAHGGAYNASLKNKWLCGFYYYWDTKPRKARNFWNFNTCQKAALCCENIKTFQKKHSAAYMLALRNDWLKEICRHMTPLGNNYYRQIYAIEFQTDKTVYIGLSKNPAMRQQQHIKTESVVGKKMQTTPAFLKVLTPLLPKLYAKEQETYYFNLYKNQEWKMLNIKATGGLGGGQGKWTKEAIIAEAQKYKTLNEFTKQAGSAYIASIKLNILPEINSLLTRKIMPSKKWNYETVLLDAKQYHYRNEFRKNSKSAYAYAFKNKLLETICAHMTKPPHHMKGKKK